MSPKFLDKEGVQIAITDETGKFMPEIISQSICMAGNLETNPVGENFQFPVIELKEVSPNRGKDGHDNWEKEEEDLASFLKIKGIKGPLAALPKRVRKHIENLPTEGAELTPVRARLFWPTRLQTNGAMWLSWDTLNWPRNSNSCQMLK